MSGRLPLCIIAFVSFTVLSAAQKTEPEVVTLGGARLKAGDVIQSSAAYSQVAQTVVSQGGKTLQTAQEGETREDKRSVHVLQANEDGDAVSIKVTFKKFTTKVIKGGTPVEVPNKLNGQTFLVRLADGVVLVQNDGELPLDPKVEAEVKAAFQTPVGPVLVQRKLGKLLGGKTFQVGETVKFSSEDVRQHMGLPASFDVDSMHLSLQAVKKKSLLNPRAAVFQLKLSLLENAPAEAKELVAVKKIALEGLVLLSIESGHLLSVNLKGKSLMKGTMTRGEEAFDLNSSGNITQQQLQVYSRG